MYGITEEIKKYIDLKIEKNKTYLKNLTFYNEDYKLVSMFDSDMNANLSPERYFAEVNNRVNTLFKYAKELDLYSVFLTITAPSSYHFKSDKYNGSTPRQTALFLSQIWAKFRHLKIFKHIKDNSGHNMIYIRVYEPHKSGVPHLHAMIFLPKNYVKEVKSKFFEHFTKFEISNKSLKFISNFTHAKYEDSKGAIAYILKYMNKTFKNAKDNIMTNEAYYFAYHGIRRFITSQTLVPLWIYRRIKHNEDSRNLYLVTNQYKSGVISSSSDKTFITKKYLHKDIHVIDEEIISCDESLQEDIIYQKNYFISEQFKNYNLVYDVIPTTWTKKPFYIPTFQNGFLIGHFYKNKFIEYKKHICDMSNYELTSFYNSYDVDTRSYVYYLAARNLMIERKLLIGDIISLNNFSLLKHFGLNVFTWYSAKSLGLIEDKRSFVTLCN